MVTGREPGEDRRPSQARGLWQPLETDPERFRAAIDQARQITAAVEPMMAAARYMAQVYGRHMADFYNAYTAALAAPDAARHRPGDPPW